MPPLLALKEKSRDNIVSSFSDFRLWSLKLRSCIIPNDKSCFSVIFPEFFMTDSSKSQKRRILSKHYKNRFDT